MRCWQALLRCGWLLVLWLQAGAALAQQDTLVLDSATRIRVSCLGMSGAIGFADYQSTLPAAEAATYQGCTPTDAVPALGQTKVVDSYTAHLLIRNNTATSSWVYLIQGTNVSGLRAWQRTPGGATNLIDSIGKVLQGPKHIAIPITLPPGAVGNYYLAARDYDTAVYLMPQDAYYAYYRDQIFFSHFAYAIFFGICIVLLLANMVYWVASKNRIYKYYIGHFFCVVLYIVLAGNFYEYYLAPRISFGIIHISLLLALASMQYLMRFTISFLALQGNKPAVRLARLNNYLNWVCAITITIMFFNGESRHWLLSVAAMAGFMGSVCWILWAMYIQLRAQQPLAGRFTLAFGPLLLVYLANGINEFVLEFDLPGISTEFMDTLILVVSVYQFMSILGIMGQSYYEGQRTLVESQQETILLTEENQSITEHYAQELEVQLQELKKTKDQLALNEKLTTLGQLAAGIIHEINTPLGVTRSALESLRSSTDLLANTPLEQLLNYTPADIALVQSLVADSTRQQAILSSKEERALRKSYAELLTSWGAPEADTTSNQLVSMGYQGKLATHKALFVHPRRDELFQLATALSQLLRNQATARMAVQKVSLIVQSLKKYAYGLPNAAVERFNLAENVQTIAILYAYQIKEKAHLLTELDTDLYIEANPDEVGQVWTNLIVNALQAMPAGTAGTIALRVSKEETGGQSLVVCTVTDNGSGIPPDVLPKIFDPFFTTKPKGEGTGIGLSLCQEIVARYGGTMSVASEPGSTVFATRFPAA